MEERRRHNLARLGCPFMVLAAGILCFASTSYAQNRNLVVTPVNSANRAVLTGHRPAWAAAQNDMGAIPADQVLGQFEFVLARSPQQQQAFDEFLREQQDPASPNYHHWLTPVEVGERFGASQNDLDAITNWLQSLNLHVDSIANSRVRIKFSGQVSSIANAFGAEMHYYRVNGERRFSISAEPQIPAALAGVIKFISGVYSATFHPAHGSRTVSVPTSAASEDGQGDFTPDFTSGTSHFLFPSDFATIYDLPTATITGAGQAIAVMGESRVYAPDITNFQTRAGLATQAPVEIIPPLGVDPGPAASTGGASEAQSEATLDVTRATSIAPGATIDLVVSAPTQAGGGITTAIEYVIETSPVPAHIMTISFSGCETSQPEDAFWDNLFRQASLEGISVFVASGDGGAAGCDDFFATPPASQILSINTLCASSHVTCVGGTEFADTANPATYWATTNRANFESALSYIPEGGWNEPGTTQPLVAASGGGFSAYIPTPSWQTGTGVPGNQGRYTPDVAFSSSGHDGYFACLAAGNASCVGNSQIEIFSGTSAAAPDMAGIAALLNQKIGSPQGELNANLYKLAAMPSNNVFHDVTVGSSGVSGCVITTPSMCNNSTPGPTSQTGGLSGYQVGTGYDEVTGLGSIDVGNLLANWSIVSTTTTLTSNLNPVFAGTSVTFTATVTDSTTGTLTGAVTFLDNGTSIGTGTLNSGAVATLVTTVLAVGSHSITAQYSGDTNFAASTSAALTEVVNSRATVTVVVSSLNPSVFGQSVTFTGMVTGTGATPTGTMTFFDGATSLGPSITMNAGGAATFIASALGGGSHSITAHYSGDTNFNASTSAALTEVVSKLSTTTTLTSSLNPSVGGLAVTFTSMVSSTAGGTPTGTVMFLDGATSLGTGTVNGSGVATLATSALSVATHSITASYGGDTNFAPSVSSAVTQIVGGMGFGSVTAQTVTAGQSVVFTLTAYTAGGTPPSLVLGCVGLPAKSTCVFNPTSVTPGPLPNGTSIQLMFATSSSQIPGRPQDRTPAQWEMLGILAGVLGLLVVGMRQSQFGPRLRLAFGSCLAVIILAAVMSGCGGTTASTPSYTGTTKGTTTFTVMGTSGGITISTPVTVTVE